MGKENVKWFLGKSVRFAVVLTNMETNRLWVRILLLGLLDFHFLAVSCSSLSGDITRDDTFPSIESNKRKNCGTFLVVVKGMDRAIS